MVYPMIYPVWSGINAEQINSTPINDVAPTPLIVFDGFDSSAIPVLMGSYAGMYADVMHARFEQRAMKPYFETINITLSFEDKELEVLPQDRAMEAGRSRKDYP